jgi:hypothetical protein
MSFEDSLRYASDEDLSLIMSDAGNEADGNTPRVTARNSGRSFEGIVAEKNKPLTARNYQDALRLLEENPAAAYIKFFDPIGELEIKPSKFTRSNQFGSATVVQEIWEKGLGPVAITFNPDIDLNSIKMVIQ